MTGSDRRGWEELHGRSTAGLVSMERRRIVHDALDELPDHYRRVVQLRDLQEQSTPRRPKNSA